MYEIIGKQKMNASTNKQVKANRTNCITNDINDLWVYVEAVN